MAKLDSDTWKLIYPWLEQAQDVPPSELAAWLDRLTAERPDVAGPLREVLAQSQDVEEQGFLEQPYVFTPEKSRVGGGGRVYHRFAAGQGRHGRGVAGSTQRRAVRGTLCG